MNDSKLKVLVDRGVEIDRQIRVLTNERKAIADALIVEAESRVEEMQATEGGGSSIRFVGLNGCAANVAFPSPSLKASIAGAGKTIEKVMKAAGRHFSALFNQVPAWKPVDNFRDVASNLLGVPGGRKLIKLCESPSTPRVAFETKDVEA